ncbi:ATP-binding cassette domain-containing protein [Chitinophagaceae bacterium MMS25-I14]
MNDQLVAEQVYFSAQGKDILKGATIRADKGMITCLLGSNGSGKSTLLKAVFGILPAGDKWISWNGHIYRKPYSVNGLLNYLPQIPFLPDRKMRKLLKMMDIDEKVLFAYFPELEGDLNKKVSKLSGGMERLWSIVLLVLAPVKFTMLDEPFTHIMPLYIERLKQLICDYRTEKGFIITDHMHEHVLEIQDRLYFMKSGQSFLLKNKEDLVLHGYLSTI